MQFRLHASKTIARPQFRELAPQQYLDTEPDRTFFGNQFLTDSELLNAEARYEWYFDRDQRLSLAGFSTQLAPIGSASCREIECQYMLLSVVAVSLKKKKKQ